VSNSARRGNLVEIDPPRDLTIPEAGSTTARSILSRAIGGLLSDLAALPRAAAAAIGTGIAAGSDLPAFQRAVGRALKASPGAVASAVRSPAIGALIRGLRPGRMEPAEALLVEVMGLIGLELARASGFSEPLRLRWLPRRLISIQGRFEILLPENTSALVFANGRVSIERGPGDPAVGIDISALERAENDLPIQVNRPYHVIDGDLVLALADNNPLAMAEAHPDKSGNAVDLGGRSPGAWVSALRDALALIERCLPDLRREIDLYIHQFIPVGWDEQRHLSASYQEAIGTIYLSLHPSPMTMVEAVIHEFSHNKLNALFELDEVLENAWSPLYSSPVRPDPRPLHGVLLAVHAFLPVARLYERMIELGDPRSKNAAFHKRFEQIRQVNSEGAATLLENARPTPVGRGLIDEIRRWDAYYAGYQASP
jgi:HEXXH motif-containing protein